MSKPIALGIVLFALGVLVGRLSVVTAGAQASAPVAGVAPSMGKPATGRRAEGAVPGGALIGKVAEVLQVPQYTYLRLESGEWAAVDSVPELKVGDEATVLLQNEMQDFASPSLNRTFARLWFGTLEGAPPVARKAPAPAPVAAAAPEVKAALAAVGSGGALTLRVVDVYTERAMLSGKRVKVKGTVDRVNFVQGVHYLHLKDGTGDAAQKTDDLLCISSSDVEKGKSVVMEGVVALDKNVGMGPVPVVLDQASAL
jgi:hypothetical protein